MNIVHLTLKPYQFDSRIRKEVASALALLPQARVLVIAKSAELPAHESAPRCEVRRLRFVSPLPNRFGGYVLKYLDWLRQVRVLLREFGVDVLHIHGIRTLHAGVVLRREFGCRLVYDAHELETEANGVTGLPKPAFKLLEHRLMRSVDALMVVAPSILDWYRRHRPAVPTELVRNIPTRAARQVEPDDSRSYRRRFGLPEDAIVFVLQGALLPGRGIEALLTLFAERNDERHLVLMGYGTLLPRVERAAAASRHVHVMPGVPSEDVVAWVSGADVGVFLLEPSCLSYECAMPNKFFEFLLAGIPALVTPRLEMKRLVAEYDCGWVVPDGSDGAADLPAVAARLAAIDRAAIASKRPGALKAREALCWERDEPALLRAYGLSADVAECPSSRS